jgi:hypothetical protein
VQILIPARWDSHDTVEKAGEVTLVDEPYFESSAHNAAPFEKKIASFAYSALNKIVVGRDPNLFDKDAMKMKGTQEGNPSQLLE